MLTDTTELHPQALIAPCLPVTGGRQHTCGLKRPLVLTSWDLPAQLKWSYTLVRAKTEGEVSLEIIKLKWNKPRSPTQLQLWLSSNHSSIVFIGGMLELMDKCLGDVCMYIWINDVNVIFWISFSVFKIESSWKYKSHSRNMEPGRKHINLNLQSSSTIVAWIWKRDSDN